MKRPSLVQLRGHGSDSWIGVDLDRTLAHYESGSKLEELGEVKPKVRRLVLSLIDAGYKVKIMTARVDPAYRVLARQQIRLIWKWLKENGLPRLEVTATKDFKMICLIDDRAFRVSPNEDELCPACGEALRAMLGVSAEPRVRDSRLQQPVLR